jgi:flavin reductase (DIM6/NTAB) family NADH-FMN oxidoreductase RutF
MLSFLETKKSFGVSVLKAGHEALSEYFSRGEQSEEAEERLSIRYRWTRAGIPVLENTLLQLSCKLVASHISGDHTIYVGEVEDAEMHEGEPLVYFRGEYRRIARHS